MLCLYTFTISHFSEKVRWALDFEGIEYTERRLSPGLHIPVIRWRAPKSCVPLFVHDKTVVQGSSTILDYMQNTLGATRLAPSSPELAKRAAEIEAKTDKAFGTGIQRIFYSALLQDHATLIDLWTQGAPRWMRVFYTLTLPVMAIVVRRKYAVFPAPIAEATDRFQRTFDELDAILEKNEFLLGGDAPTRADISVASLLAPLCTPPNHVLKWPARLGEEATAFIESFEGRPTWNWVLRMYRDHRYPTDASLAS